MNELQLIFRIAARNCFARVINLVIGGLVFGVAFTLTFAGTLVRSVNQAMNGTIRETLAGDLQVYSQASADDLDFWSLHSVDPDVAPLPEWGALRKALVGNDNVQDVVPLGFGVGIVPMAPPLDRTLEQLRRAVSEGTTGTSEANDLKLNVRRLVTLQRDALRVSAELSPDSGGDQDANVVLERALSPDFWSRFDSTPLASLEFLENRVAPIAFLGVNDWVPLQYFGTHLSHFAEVFRRFQIVDGTLVPEGERGLLLSKYAYEEVLKNKIARRLDLLRVAVEKEGRHIRADSDLLRMVNQNRAQAYEIVNSLTPATERVLVNQLQKYLGSTESRINALLAQFLETDDSNVLDRYRFFYSNIAPHIDLYRMKVGNTYTVRGFTRWGYPRAINIKLFGTFTFRGLDESPLTADLNLMDLMSFRDLYGYPNSAEGAEIEEMRSVFKTPLTDHPDSLLFGSPPPDLKTSAINIDALLKPSRRRQEPDSIASHYSQSDLDSGVVTNVAILLRDPTQSERTMSQIAALRPSGSPPLRVVPGIEVAGLLGQIIQVGKVFLDFGALMIFIVLILVMNSALIMATLRRISEIGTMRAIGATKRFVRSVTLLETILLAGVFSGGGVCVAMLVLRSLARLGIPGNGALSFFFSGPRLFPVLSYGIAASSFGIVMLLCGLSALYPAIIATRTPPMTAIREQE